ncbi:hypothetical protein Tco_1398751 [Tanacetum coccineum]
MEKYIRLEEEKARRHGKVYNWETATYGRIWDDDEVNNLRSVETKFPAIVFDDALTSDEALSYEPTVSPLNDNEIDFRISFDEFGDEDYTIWHLYNLEIRDTRGSSIKLRDTLRISCITSSRDLRRYLVGDEGHELFTSHAWRRLFEIRGPLVREFILEFLSSYRMSDTEMGLDVADALCFRLGGARRRMTWRQFIMVLGLHTVDPT